MRMKRGAFVFIILLFSAIPAGAQNVSAGLLAGYAVLTGDASGASDDAICLGAYGDWFIDPDIAIEGAILYSQHDDVISEAGSHEVDVLSFMIGPKFLFPRPKMTPYLSFGPSLNSLDYRFDPEGGPGTARDDSDTEAGLFATAGVGFPLGRGLSLSFSLTYHYIFNTDVLDGDIITSTIGIGF